MPAPVRQPMQKRWIHPEVDAVLEWFWRWWFWLVPANLVALASDRYWGGPYYGERLGPGRFERMAEAPLLAGLSVLCGLCISCGLLHTRRRRLLFTFLCAGAAFADLWYVSSIFAWSMMLLSSAPREAPWHRRFAEGNSHTSTISRIQQ
jgi:hypothetical protein